jgi:hypothetical protein
MVQQDKVAKVNDVRRRVEICVLVLLGLEEILEVIQSLCSTFALTRRQVGFRVAIMQGSRRGLDDQSVSIASFGWKLE